MKSGVLSTWFRLFTVQGSWNYERMLGIGLAYAIEPLLRGLPGGENGSRYRDALSRAARFFNAHPYLTGGAVGAVARAEHDSTPPEQIERLKVALTGPLGSVGDRLIWAGALPASAGVGLAVCASGHPLLGAAIFLVIYNAAHLSLRWWALSAGWHSGIGIARALGGTGIKRGLELAGPLAGLSVGFALPLAALWLTRDLDAPSRIGVVALVGVGVVVGRWLIPTLGAVRFGLGTAVVALLAGWLWA